MIEILEAGQGTSSARLRVSGDWTFSSLHANARSLKEVAGIIRARSPDSMTWELRSIETMDEAGAVWLANAMRGAPAVELPPRFQVLMQQAVLAANVPSRTQERFAASSAVVALGRTGLLIVDHLRDAVALLGQLAIDAFRLMRRPAEIPFFEISANIYRSGVTALPVTMLVGFLVGVVLTYLSALQLKKFGADLLVINIVAVGVVRELGPMLASIIAAGRSGSTMTAQLGVMRVTEEIEALSVMGISVTSRLVLPKVIGLACALPLVTFATDVAALAGAMLISKITLGIEHAAFLQALPRVLDVTNFWIGICKSIVFGFAVAFVACHYGLRILPNTDSLGAGVTKSVVSAITSVILLNAVFAIALRNVG